MNSEDNRAATIVDLMASQNNASDKDGDLFLSQNIVDANLDSALNVSSIIAVATLLKEANMLVPGSRLEQSFSDEYRKIKRPLLENAFGKAALLVENGNLILITSAVTGEGKTHTAANLALSIAQEKDHTVLLVDCDVNKYGISRMFDVVDKPGLVDVLMEDNLDIGSVLLRTDIPELCIIGAGRKYEYVTELLASHRMSEFVSEISNRYEDRVIIFDAPPVLPTPQTQVLAGLVGQIAFVIEAGKTSQVMVEDALEMLPGEKATNLIMNKCEHVTAHNNYYYGYYGSES